MAVKVKTKNVVDYIDFYGIKKEVLGSIEKLLSEDEIYVNFRGDDSCKFAHIVLSKYRNNDDDDFNIREPVLLDSVDITGYGAREFCERIKVLTK